MMDYNTVAVLHGKDPTIATLRKDWIPLAVSFLYDTFKRRHEVAVPQGIFREKLEAYLEHINVSLPEDRQHRHEPDYYLDRWTHEDDIIRVRQRDIDYVIQLSPSGERLLALFEDIQNRGMIGTESRLSNIISLLDEVVTQSNRDVNFRLKQLYDRREQIDAEIALIQATGEVGGFSDVQIRERLDHITEMATQLLRDFSQLEERFRDLARTIQQAYLQPDARRGDVLGTALDGDEQLETSPEGQSFRGFYELLTQPDRRDKFEAILHAVFQMPRLANFTADNTILQRLTSHLLDAGERVNQSNQRLAEHLRRVVDTTNITESRRVQTLAREIKHIVSQMDDETYLQLGSRRSFMSIEGDPDVDLPLDRPLFDPPARVTASERPQSAPHAWDEALLMAMFTLAYVDEAALHANIERLLMSRPEVTLAEVLKSYPATQGIAEVIAYMVMASRSAQHEIDRTAAEVIGLPTDNGAGDHYYHIPRVIFRRENQPEGLSA
jgi:hypothetical protein